MYLKDAIELRINNFTFREIHELLGISVSQAEYRFKKMKYLLKEKMEKWNTTW